MTQASNHELSAFNRAWGTWAEMSCIISVLFLIFIVGIAEYPRPRSRFLTIWLNFFVASVTWVSIHILVYYWGTHVLEREEWQVRMESILKKWSIFVVVVEYLAGVALTYAIYMEDYVLLGGSFAIFLLSIAYQPLIQYFNDILPEPCWGCTHSFDAKRDEFLKHSPSANEAKVPLLVQDPSQRV